MKARQESDHSEHLERDEDDENEKIELFVFKHAARWTRTEQPTGPQLNPEVAVSHGRETISNRCFGNVSAQRVFAFPTFRMRSIAAHDIHPAIITGA